MQRSMTGAGASVGLLVARILLVLIFPISAYYKITGWPGIVTMLTGAGMPLPWLGGVLAVVAEIALPLLVILGLWTRPALIGLILYTLATSFIAHRFWEFSGGAYFGQLVSFLKNLSMVAGLALLFVSGPGRIAMRP